MDYRSIYSVPEEADRSLAYVAEGASIPATAIRTREHLVRLYKRGRMLVASYEALRFQKLDLFSVMLRQIGAQIQAMHLEDAVNVLRNGDGNDNAAAVFTAGTSPISGEKGTLTYAQLVEFWAQFAPYEMNTMLVSNATMVRLLKLTELQNPLTGLNFQGTGKFETPLGASLLRTQAMADGCILAFDRRYALEMVQAATSAWNMTSSSTASSSARPSRPSPASARSARRRRRCSRYDGHERGDHAAAVRILGTEEELLTSENIFEADAFVSLTGRDEENLLMALTARRAGVPKVLAKMTRPNYMDLVRDMRVGSIVSPKDIVANQITRYVRAWPIPRAAPWRACIRCWAAPWKHWSSPPRPGAVRC